MPSITQLTYILALAKYKHFSRAAQHCNVSQPSLSAQIQKCEQDIDCIIFDRSKNPILITDKGKKIIEQAKKILFEHKQLLALSHENEDTVQGQLHIAVIPTLSPYLIPLFIETFAKQYPKVQLKISEMKTQDCIEALQDDTIDAALLVTPLQHESIIERHLFYEAFYVFCSSQHPFYKLKDVQEKQMSGKDLWLLNEGHCFRNQVSHVCKLKQASSVLPNVTFESGNLETLKTLILQGHGYTLLPHLALKNLKPNILKNNVKTFKGKTPSREVSLVHSRMFLKEALLEALNQVILDCIPDELLSLKKKQTKVTPI